MSDRLKKAVELARKVYATDNNELFEWYRDDPSDAVDDVKDLSRVLLDIHDFLMEIGEKIRDGLGE